MSKEKLLVLLCRKMGWTIGQIKDLPVKYVEFLLKELDIGEYNG